MPGATPSGSSRIAAGQTEAEFIVFCGVHFMAESADVLTGDHQQVLLPDLNAGCSMADMADIDQVEEAWDELARVIDVDGLIPVTYMNSAASLKAFVGRHGGAVCTSSNARAVLTWALDRSRAGASGSSSSPTSISGGTPASSSATAPTTCGSGTPGSALGGLSDREVKESTLLLWKGHCSVHQRFRPAHVEAFRAEYPDGIVMVHPECAHDVVELGDVTGSTDAIIRAVAAAPSGSVIGVATEIHLVNRLNNESPDKTVVCLDPLVCPCSTMSRIDPAAPGLGPGGSGGRRGAQPHCGRPRDDRVGQGRARADAGHHLSAVHGAVSTAGRRWRCCGWAARCPRAAVARR